MNDKLKIESILGIVASENHLRASRDGKAFEELLPAPTWTEETVKRNGSVNDTVNEMKKIIRHYTWQTAKLAPVLKGKDVYETCENIWNFLFEHIKYKEDDEGQEQLRTAARSWAQRRSRGIDCDDFTIFCCLILKHIPEQIPCFYIRIARYAGKDYFQHVYPIVPLPNKQYITIDAVLDQYDTEKTPVETKDFLVMNTNNLSGIDISVLGGIEDEALNELSGLLSGEDFKEVNELEGLGTEASEDQVLGAIRNHLVRTRNVIARHPHLVREVEHPESFLGMVDYALKYWDTDKREEALGVLEGEENRMNELEGLGNVNEGHEDVELFYGLNSLGSYDILGKAKRQRKFFTKVKQAVKKAGQGIKKIGKGLVRYNPAVAGIRAGVLLALKVNLLKVASKLKWGYLTEREAQTHGFDMGEWRKVKTQLAKSEAMFVNTLQGKAENFKRAILTGRAGKLSGTDLGLGVVAATAAAASTAAALPFITKILTLLKDINFNKLLAKVKVSKLQDNTKEADTDQPTEDGHSAMPEGGEVKETAAEPAGKETPQNETPASADTNQDISKSIPEIKTAKRKTTITTDTPADDKGSADNNPTDTGGDNNANPDNLPAVNARGKNEVAKPTDLPTENPMLRMATWVQQNPGYSLMIGAGAVFVISRLLKPHRQLAGARRGRKKTGKAKTNPPKTVSGTKGGKTKRKGKKGSGKRKGGDGQTFQL